MKFALVLPFFLIWPCSSLANASGFGANDKWWQCYHFFQVGVDDKALTGRLVRNANFDGSHWTESYEMWGKGVRIKWNISDVQSKTKRQVHSIGIEMPATASKNGHGIYGYLFGDSTLLATTTLLTPHFARKKYVASRAFFQNKNTNLNLWDHNIWSFVAVNGDGSEIVRRDLPIPTRNDLDTAYQTHRESIEIAWAKRNPEKLTTTPADSLPKDKANCLLSTPASRDEEELGSI